jgi:hypothetical protein
MMPRWACWAVLGLVTAPFIYEVLAQTVLQAQLYRRMSPEAQALLPRHPSRPGLLWLGSEAFFGAFLRFIVSDEAEEPPDVRRLKTRLRTSIRRELGFQMLGLVLLTAVACIGLVQR